MQKTLVVYPERAICHASWKMSSRGYNGSGAWILSWNQKCLFSHSALSWLNSLWGGYISSQPSSSLGTLKSWGSGNRPTLLLAIFTLLLKVYVIENPIRGRRIPMHSGIQRLTTLPSCLLNKAAPSEERQGRSSLDSKQLIYEPFAKKRVLIKGW